MAEGGGGGMPSDMYTRTKPNFSTDRTVTSTKPNQTMHDT